MESNEKDVRNDALWTGAPKLPEAPPFTANARQITAAALSYLPAYLYTLLPTLSGTAEHFAFLLLGFTALYCILTELLYHDIRPSAESFCWLGCLWVTAICLALGRCRVWGDWWAMVLLHGLAIYWVLVRSGRLCRGKSSVYLPLDALHALIRFPFGQFALRFRTLWYALTRRGNGNSARRAGVAAACLLAAILFVAAVSLLAGADRGFAGLVDGFLGLFRNSSWQNFLLRLAFSIPIGMYLYGLIAGTGRTAPDVLAQRADRLARGVAALRRVPALAWTCLLAAFCALYLLFFAFQGSYLFGAFARTLPADFTVAEYARQGFFELCRIMGLNFALYWLACYTGDAPARTRKPLKAMVTALLIESILFAVTAFSKLALYISCFSFTPKRLQSAWLICVLCAGSALALYHLWTERPAFRKWLLFSAVTCALLNIY